MSAADIATLQARLTDLEQENNRLRSRLQSCEQSHGVLQAEVAAWQRQQQDWQEQREIAREQEKAAQERAVELAKANAVLRRATDRLASEPSLEAFLGHVLAEACQDAIESGVILLYEETQAYLVPAVMQGVAADYPYSAQHPVPIAAFPTWSALLRTRQPLVVSMDKQPELFAGETLAWHRAQGHQGIVVAPLMIGDRPLGMFGIASCSKVAFKEADLELFQALAQQATLAIQLTRLAEEAKQAAIACQQEQAAQDAISELMRANDIMRECLDQISQATDLDQLCPSVLGSLIKLLGAVGGSLWRYDPSDGSVTLEQELADGQFHTRETSGFAHAKKHFFTPDHAPSFEKHQRLIAGETLTLDVRSSDVFLLNEREHLLSQGINTLIVFPMTASGQHLGRLALAFHTGRVLLPSECELAKSLANQAALVLQMADMAEEAKQAAIAREQEKAAQERAAELAKANEVLRRSLDALVAEQTLPGFLGHVLTSITHQLTSPSSVLWLYDREQRTANLSLVFNGQTVKPASQTHHPNAKHPRDYSSPERARAWDAIIQQRQSSLLVVAEKNRMTPSQRDYLLGQGIWGILSLPLVLGDRTEGTFAIHFYAPRQFRKEELELVQTLANQAALAIQMAQLAEQAKEAALLEERNRLAGEIHDTLAQAFTGISMQLSVAKWLLQQDPIAVDHILDRINDIAQGGLAEARRSVWTLYPVEQAYADLAQQLSRCVQQMTSGTTMQVDVQISGSPCPLPPLVGKNLLRIGQEAITNTLKHAQATVLKIHLTYTEATLCLCLQDNGRGFITDSDYTGFGLISMSDRADRIGGQLTINSQPGQGTETKIQVPLP